MKHIIFMLASFICVIEANAQDTSPRYDTCSQLQTLEGEWRHINGVDTICIYLRTHRSKSTSFNSITDDLWGWIEYKRGSILIESTYSNRFAFLPYETDNLPHNFESLKLRTDSCSTTITKLFGVITDFSQGKEPKIVKAVVDANGTTMTWRQSHVQGYGFFSGYFGMTLPKEFILIKQ